MASQHGVQIAQGGNDGNGRQFPLGIGQHIPFKNIGEQVFFKEHIHCRGKLLVSRFGAIHFDL